MDKQYCILNWMDGDRKYFETEIEALNVFNELRKEYLENNAEFDMECFKILANCDNVSEN